MADLFGVAGRELLDSLALPEPWKTNLVESLALVDDLSTRIDALESELRSLGADHPSMRLLMTVPGVGWVLAYTIASEIGDISRFASPKKLAGYNRAVPARSSVRGQGPARATGQERPDVPSLGPDRGRPPTPPGIVAIAIDTSAPRRGSVASVAPRSPGSISPASWPRRSGMSSLRTSRSIRQAPPSVWSPDDPR